MKTPLDTQCSPNPALGISLPSLTTLARSFRPVELATVFVGVIAFGLAIAFDF